MYLFVAMGLVEGEAEPGNDEYIEVKDKLKIDEHGSQRRDSR